MDFNLSDHQRHYLDRVTAFMNEHIVPAIPEYEREMSVIGQERWKVVQVVEELKKKARAAGLWNFFMPPHSGQVHVDDTFQFEGIQLTNLEYSLIAEQLGKVGFASEVFNCSAPDTGNMEVLMRYGTLAQKETWLRPLMNGEIRSAFLMTEPDVASSDATNIQTEIRREGDEYVINGRKWWSSGVGDPRCKVAIVMGRTNPENERHAQQSQVLVPRPTATPRSC
jgi:acyl-CoA dehydrogenase